MVRRTLLGILCLLAIIGMLFGGIALADEGAILSIEIEQLDIVQADETVIENSHVGSAILTYVSMAEVEYFNLVVDGVWVVQNIPVLAAAYAEVQSLTFLFPFEIPDGESVEYAAYGGTVTPHLVWDPPGMFEEGPVIDRKVRILPGSSLPDPLPPLWPWVLIQIETGEEVVDWAVLQGAAPNQDCGLNECNPTAASNSLKYLDDLYDLDLPPCATSIEVMKGAMHFDPGHGVYWKDWGGVPAWWKAKDAFMKSAGFPITTRRTSDPQDALDELKRGQDVELQAGGHAVMVVGMARLADGRYVIYVAHDTNQGNGDDPDDGDTRIEKVILTPDGDDVDGDENGKLEGGTWIDGTPFRYFVIECPIIWY